MNKKIGFLFAALLIQLITSAQSFKDIYESLEQNDRFSNMMNLRHYQSLNPDHAVTYFLLGDIYDEYMREANPLVMFDVVETNFKQLETYWGLIKSKLDEKQARQDREYFGTVEISSENKKVGLEDLLNEVDKRLTASRDYYNNATKVHANYIRCINKYNECLFKFREILADYPHYKTLFMLANQKLIDDIQTISLNFDSSLIYFDEYKRSCSKLTHLLSVNTYQLNRIETYRLEGLIEADFALPVVMLWDFKTWANSFLEIINTDIAQIRTGLIENDNALNVQIEKLKSQEVYADEMPYYRTEDKFQNLIGKYDHASLSNELIDYKQLKVKYLLATRAKMNDVFDSSNFFLINKLWFFSNLAQTKVSLNKQADLLKKSISIESIGKYVDFYAKQYNGMDGLIRWCEVEKWDNDLIFNKNLFNLKAFVDRDKQRYTFTDSVLIYQKKKIAYGVQYPNWQAITADTIITTAVYPFKKNWHYLSGYEVNKQFNRKPFIAKVNSGGKVEWLINPKIEKSNSDSVFIISQIQLLDDSTCVVAASSLARKTSNELLGQTFILKYNWEGKLIDQFSADVNFKPVYFHVDEINEQYLLVSESQFFNDSSKNEREMKISLYSYSDSLTWSHRFLIAGNLVDVVNINSNFLICFNYTSAEFSTPTKMVLDTTGTGRFVSVFISHSGKIEWINTYETDKNMQLTACYKLTSDELNFIGEVKDEQTQVNEIFYMLTNVHGEPRFSNDMKLKFNSLKLTD